MKNQLNPIITTLHDLLDIDAGRFTNAEVQLKNKIPEWMKTSSSLKLNEVLQKYLTFVEQHIEDFNVFFETEKISILSTSNRIMQAMITELEEKMDACTDPEVRDACLLAGIQEINHYKISTYGTAAAFASTLDKTSASGLFHDAEANEKLIDDRLTQLAKFEINKRAVHPVKLMQ